MGTPPSAAEATRWYRLAIGARASARGARDKAEAHSAQAGTADAAGREGGYREGGAGGGGAGGGAGVGGGGEAGRPEEPNRREENEAEGERLPGGDASEADVLSALAALYDVGGAGLAPDPRLKRQFELLARSSERRSRDADEASEGSENSDGEEEGELV